MTKEEVTTAILFADISKSTSLYEELGDRKAQKIISIAVNALAKATLKNKGTVVKTIGDEVMSVFRRPDQALEAAILMQRVMQQLSNKLSEELKRPLNMQAGIHWGPAIYENDDYFGDAVNLAARIVGLAKERQVLTSGQTVERLPPRQRAMLRKIDSTKVKGKKEEVEIFEVIWERRDVTVMLDSVQQESDSAAARETCLKLTFADQSLCLSEKYPAASIGRHPSNDIVVNDDLVSRLHARIELRRGQFIISDQSINGTYVLLDDDKQNYLRRDEYPLQGKGFISVGREVEQSPNAIFFCCDGERFEDQIKPPEKSWKEKIIKLFTFKKSKR